MRTACVAALLVTLLAPGCASDAASGRAGPAVRDSAGIEIVESPADARQVVPRWPVGETPLLEIGTVEEEGPELFANVGGVGRLSDGTVVVLDRGAQELRYFDPEGQHVATAGGAGQGPGEFSLPQGPWILAGDTVAVWDMNQQRFTFFGPRGEVLETVRPSTPVSDPAGFIEGRILGMRRSTASARPGDAEGVQRSQKVLQRLDLRAGSAPDTIAVMGDLGLFQWSEGSAVGFTYIPFTVDASAAAGGGRFATTPGTIPELRIFDATGDLRRILRIDSEPASLPASAFQQEVERRIEAASPDDRAELRRQYDAMTPPSSLPAYMSLLVDPARGEIWAEHFRPEYASWPPTQLEPSTWSVFGEEGALRATVQLPIGFHPHEVTEEGVLGIHQDELGVHHVRHLAVARDG